MGVPLPFSVSVSQDPLGKAPYCNNQAGWFMLHIMMGALERYCSNGGVGKIYMNPCGMCLMSPCTGRAQTKGQRSHQSLLSYSAYFSLISRSLLEWRKIGGYWTWIAMGDVFSHVFLILKNRVCGPQLAVF